jgi:hypothetical protein
VEGIVETDPAKLAEIVGSEDVAKKLLTMAKRLLDSTPRAAPGTASRRGGKRTTRKKPK